MDNYFEKSREYWADIVVKGDLRYPEPQVIRFVKKNLFSGAKILDFGCGAGRDSLALASEGYEMIAMDYNQAGLEMLREKNSKIKTICNTGIEVPLEENSVDGVFADGSLVGNDKKVTVELLKNLCRVIKPGGYMWADLRTKNDYLYGKGEKIGDDFFLLGAETGMGNLTYQFYEEKGLREVYEKAGFKVISVDVGGFTQNNQQIRKEWYYVVAQKL